MDQPTGTADARRLSEGVGRRSLLKAALAGPVVASLPAWGAEARAPALPALQSLLDALVADRQVPGAALAIVNRGGFRPRFLSAGSLDFGSTQRFDARTLVRIYSMTKPVTGIAVMQQVERGRIGIDTPLAEILPEFADMRVLVDPARGLESRPATRPIRIRHLLTHTAGFSYTINGNGPLEREYRRLGVAPTGRLALQPGDTPPPDLQTMVQRLATLPLLFEPGTAYRYSIGLDVAGAVLEKLAGQPLDQVFARQLFGPLGMRETGFRVPDGAQARFAALNAWVDPKTQKPADSPTRVDALTAPDHDQRLVLLAGGAGLVSTAADYARFAQMLLNGGLFEGRRLMGEDTARLATGNLMERGIFFDTVKGFGAGGSTTLFDTRVDGPTGQPAGVYGWGGAAGTLFHIDPVRGFGMVLMVQYLGRDLKMNDRLQAALNQEAKAGLL